MDYNDWGNICHGMHCLDAHIGCPHYIIRLVNEATCYRYNSLGIIGCEDDITPYNGNPYPGTLIGS